MVECISMRQLMPRSDSIYACVENLPSDVRSGPGEMTVLSLCYGQSLRGI